MVNLKCSEEERNEASGIAEPEKNEYPYGLCLSLDDETLAKLGASGLTVGQEVTFTAKAKVTRTSQHQEENSEKETYASWQITDMEVQQPTGKSIADTLYGA
jgi:hypothetical protein